MFLGNTVSLRFAILERTQFSRQEFLEIIQRNLAARNLLEMVTYSGEPDCHRQHPGLA